MSRLFSKLQLESTMGAGQSKAEYGECEDISWLRSMSSDWELLKNVDRINNPFKELAWKNKEGNRTSIRKKNNSERVCLFVCLSWEITENMDYFQLSVEVGTRKMIH